MKNDYSNLDRYPAVSGQFYPANGDELELEILKYKISAVPKQYNEVRAIICPHAGYVFSGKIAASGFNQIDADKTYTRIFILTSSHYDYFEGASVYCDGDYQMPYGKVTVDKSFCKKLTIDFPEIFTENPFPHFKEHGVEVQLPFLHYALNTDYKIVPIIIGTSNTHICNRIASVLKPYLNSENLFVISSDFSHYPAYLDAKKIDAHTKNSILANDPETLLNTLSENSKKQIPNLATSLCGWTSVLTLLYMTSQNDAIEYHAIDYCNSGDIKLYGETDRVVGYWSIAVTETQLNKEVLFLYETEQATLLEIARDTIELHCRKHAKVELNATNFSQTLKSKCGVFVTLHKKGKLRGCIGMIKSEMPLYQTVQDMALSAAINDNRFEPVKMEELDDIDVEISILSPFNIINNIKEIIPGKHGIFIEKGHHSGLFLPQVATESGWSLDDFLGHCSRDKAGLDWDGWKSANIYTFTTFVFGEKKFSNVSMKE
jgi:hypothetical protein